MTDRRIGIDFDNTLVLYDRAFREYGIRRGLLPTDFTGDKNAARALIRSRPDGADAWTALQAEVYGPGLALAEMTPGAAEALARIHGVGWRIFIVSHKTAYAAADPQGVNLRDAAWAWLDASGLLRETGGPIARSDVFFESTRAEKIARIATTGCAMFLDDLEEVYLEADFPPAVDRHLLVLDTGRNPEGPYRIARDWGEFAERAGFAVAHA